MARATGRLRARALRLLPALAALALIVGTAGLAVRRADRVLRADLLRQTRLVALAMDFESIQALSGTEADLGSPDYRRLKEQLTAVRSAGSQCRFVYLMGRKADGAIFFFVDSEPSGSRDYSPPGQLYEEVSAGFRRVFDARIEVVEGPVADRWGVWVSALVPLVDPLNGAVVAVLGMDIDAGVWKWDVAARAAPPVGLLLVLLIGAAAALAATRRVEASPKPVLRRLLPPLAVMVLLLVVGAGALLYQQHQQRLAGDIAADIADASGDLRAALSQQASGLAAAVLPVVADATVQKALREGDADRLLALWQPVFETLRRERGLTHFYFLDADRVCLLRVHKPDRRGDLIDRFTAREAERTGTTASGIELGPLGTFTLRVVQPVFEGGTLVGYVELGKEIEDALQTMHSQPGNQLAVVIRKEYLNRQIWEEGMRLLGREADWDRLVRNVVIYTSQGRLPEAFATWADSAAGDHAQGAADREIAFGGKDWRVAATPLMDAAGAEVGALLVMRDTSSENAVLARLLALGGTSGAVLVALLLGFIFVLLHRVDAGIAAQQAVLRGSEERYRTVADFTYDWEYWMAPDGSLAYVSPSCERITGYRAEEFLEDPELLIRVAHPADRDRLVSHIRDPGKRPADPGYHELDFRILTRGGEERWIGHVCRRVYGRAGEYLGRRAGNRDITDRKISEARMQRQAQLYAALSRCNEAIVRFASEEELFPQICRDAVLLGGMKMAWIGMVDETSGRVEPVASYGEGTEYLQDIRISVHADDPFGRGPTGTAIRENQPFWCRDFLHDPATAPWHERGAHVGWAASAALPLLRAGKPVGGLTLYSGQVNAFDEDIRRLLSDVASDISFALDKYAQESQRKRAEEELRNSEAFVKLVMDNLPIGIAVNSIDPAVKFNYMNDNFPKVYRTTREALAGPDAFWSAVYEDPIFREEIKGRVLADCASDDPSRMCWEDVPIARRGAETTFITARNMPIPDKQLMISAVWDVTERKRAEMELERLAAAIAGAGETIVITDPDGTIQYVNPAFERVTGYSREEAVGKNPRLLKSGEQDEVFYRGLWGTITSGRVWRGRFVDRRKDGSLYTEDATISPVLDAVGRIVSYVAVKRDITEHLLLTEEKARLEDQLRQAQKVEALGRLAGGVAHDFNNLTAIILGYGEMLLGQLSQENPLHKYVEQIVAAGRRSAALTRQLLAFSRKQTLQPEVLDLNALLRNLAKMLGRLIGEDIDLRFALAANLGRVKADPGQIEQAVTNLVVNARDAMPRGGRLTVETAEVTLDETYVLSHESVVPGRYVMFALTDTGCGMDRATMARLFEPFYTTKEKGKGTGLGLATVYGIVKQSGGYIYVYSEPGQGTTFKIYLPRTDAEQDARTVESGAQASRGGGERILLVEDETSLLHLCQTILSQLGYRVSAAGSGPAALHLAAEQRFEYDLVITDVIMPGMSGAEMVARLRRDRPGLRVLYMSGYPDDAIASHGVLDPGIPFIQKPFSERTFAAKVQEALGAMAVAARPGRSVLMIDDDEQYRDLVRYFCAKQGHVFAGADDAAAALAALGRQSFDVLLVDMNIPGTDGERVLRQVRAAGCVAPAIVLTGDVTSADMDVLRPLGAVRALEKSSRAEPLLQAIEDAAAAGGKGAAPGDRTPLDDAVEPA